MVAFEAVDASQRQAATQKVLEEEEKDSNQDELASSFGGGRLPRRGVSEGSTGTPPDGSEDASSVAGSTGRGTDDPLASEGSGSEAPSADRQEPPPLCAGSWPKAARAPPVPQRVPAAAPATATPGADFAVDGEQQAEFTGLSWFAVRALHLSIYAACIIATRVVLSVRALLACVFSGARTTPVLQREGARLSWEALSTSPDPCKVAKEVLPVPPPLPTPPEGGMTISFGPCANLMIYTGGVAACLQRCPNYAEVAPHLRFYGVSCGAFIASTMAADCDILEMLPEMLSWTAKFQGRLWGLIGAYSESITSIVWGVFSDPTRFERARGRLGFGVTAFQPHPERVAVYDFATASDLVTTLLGSCYIPVAFEMPQWSPTMGPLWDGGILEFATQGDIVVSPYESTVPEIFPRVPYPRRFTFFPPHESDAVQLFEDGYMDCLRWLQAGAPLRHEERQQVVGSGSGIRPLLVEGKRFLAAILWGSGPVLASKDHVA